MHVARVNRSDPVPLWVREPGFEQLLNKPFAHLAVLIQEQNPRESLALGPANALVQGFGDAEIFSILNEVKSRLPAGIFKRVELLDPRTVVDNDEPLHLKQELLQGCDYGQVWMISDNYGAG